MRTLWILLITVLLLSACGNEGATLPQPPADQQLDHFRLVVLAVIDSGYAKFDIRIIAENRAGDVLLNYQADWPEAYVFLLVPGWKSFVPTVEGDMNTNSWVNGVATLSCHFHRGVFCEEVCPIQGYWKLSLQNNGPVATDNSYTPWVVEAQSRVYW